MTIIKICGITTLGDGLLAAGVGADLLGINLFPPSPRFLKPPRARALADALRAALGDSCPLLVGVFVNEDAATVQRLMAECALDCAQLSGDEPPDVLAALAGRAFKSIRPRDAAEAETLAAAYLPGAPQDVRFPALLVDAYHATLYGGTGELAGEAVARAALAHTDRLMLAGGLTPDNVGARIRAIRPWGVDVASGVEGDEPGRKDETCLRAFTAAVRVAAG
ncbi:MAG: phosphoribosylanthranilate isomerase [Anaerolineae bacterium]|nr:phosphoribosylanthranilate isomerase [Anaerolineae bacterium]